MKQPKKFKLFRRCLNKQTHTLKPRCEVRNPYNNSLKYINRLPLCSLFVPLAGSWLNQAQKTIQS